MRRAYSTRWMFGTVVLALALGACEKQEPLPPPATKPAAPAATSSRPADTDLASIRDFVKDQGPRAPGGLPAGHPSIDMSQLPQAGVPGAAPPAGDVALKYKAPDAWQKEPVKSSLRVDQYRLPRADGDSEDGELAVFGTNVGGSVEANITRWRGQFTTADGQPVPDDAFKQEILEVSGLPVTFVEVTGHYNAGMAIGGSSEPKSDHRMLAAIVETPGGPYYFKAVGPAATMAQHRDAFREFLRTVNISTAP